MAPRGLALRGLALQQGQQGPVEQGPGLEAIRSVGEQALPRESYMEDRKAAAMVALVEGVNLGMAQGMDVDR